MKTLQTKFLIGLLPTLAILVGLGLWAIFMFYQLGGNIDVILRENYRSIQAAEDMKEAIERMDSGLLFAVGGQEERGRDQFAANRARFEENLKIEQGNITVHGERELADALEHLFQQYIEHANRFFALPADPPRERKALYFDQLLPTFNEIRKSANGVLELNQNNMIAMNRSARQNATTSAWLMIGALVGAVGLSVGVALYLSREILAPIHAVTEGARALARGELDQLVPASSRDELGELSNAFNDMARTLRDYRQAGTARLLRAEDGASRRSIRFPTRSSWSIRWARSSRPIARPGGCWRSLPTGQCPCRGTPRRRSMGS